MSDVLCEGKIDCIHTKAVEEGAVHNENLQQRMQNFSSTHKRRIAMGALLRGNKLKPLVAEFATYHTAFCDPQQQPKQLDSVLKLLPKEHNLQMVEDSLKQFVQELKLVRQWKFAASEWLETRLNSFERRWKQVT